MSTNQPAPAKIEKTERLIRQALKEKRVLEFRYHGFARSVEPHAAGRVGDGKVALLGWQAAGGSATEPPPGWRTFIVADIEKPKLRKTKFVARPDYDPKKTNLKAITAEIAK